MIGIRSFLRKLHNTVIPPTDYGDLGIVWKQKTLLKRSNIRMMQDFPKEIISHALAPIMFEARRQNMKY